VQATGNISGWDPSNPHIAANTSIVFPEGIRDPYVENWFFGVQHQIRAGVVVQLNYVGTAGHKLFRAEAVNRVPGALLPEGTCVTDTFGRKLCSQVNTNVDANGFAINPSGRLNPNQGFLRVWENAGNSIYHGLQLSAQKRMSHGLQVSGNYTWSHVIDSGSTWRNGGTTADGFAPGDGVSTDMTVPNLDRGNSVFDIRQRLTFNYVWELPFLQKAHGGLGRFWVDGSGTESGRSRAAPTGPRSAEALLQTPDLMITEQELAIRLPSIQPSVSIRARTTTWMG